MQAWLWFSLIAVVLWGVVGFLQKIGTTRGSADRLMLWMMVGYVVFLPFLVPHSRLSLASAKDIGIGILVGMTNGLGAWFLLKSLESGGKAAIAIPLTALYPVVTIFFLLVFMHTPLTSLQWCGVAGAVVSGVLMSYETKPDVSPAPPG